MKTIFKQLEYIIEQEDVTQAKVILTYHKQKINLDCKDKSGQTLLHKSCIQGSLPITRLLIEQGASLEIQDKEGNTALHYACTNDRYQASKYLLSNCADVYVRNYEGLQPVDLAKNSTLKMLIEMAMTLTSHENKVMTLGRIKKSKHNHNTRCVHTTNDISETSSRCSKNNSNNTEHQQEEKHGYTNLRSKYEEKRITHQGTIQEDNDDKLVNKTAKRSPVCRRRRGSLNVCKVKKMHSFGKDGGCPTKINHNMQHKFTEKKWSELQAIRRVASETDIERLNDEQQVDNNIGGKMQKVTNTEEMNLVGLSLGSQGSSSC